MTKPNPQDELERLIDANPGASDDEIHDMFRERCEADPALERAVVDAASEDPDWVNELIDELLLTLPGFKEQLRDLGIDPHRHRGTIRKALHLALKAVN